jgi:hypothetical protein
MIPVLTIPVLNRYDLLDKLLDSINYPIEKIFTVKSDPKLMAGKNITDISNKAYYDAKFAGFNWTCYNWELQRRVDNDWNCLETSV